MVDFNDFDSEEIARELVADSSTYTPPPAGQKLARCVGFIQLGTQKQEYQGTKGKDRRKIMLIWELPEDLHVFDEAIGPQPFFVSQIYSLVLGDKSTYTQHMTAWTGEAIKKDFNCFTMLGKPCYLTIVHKKSTTDPDKIRAKIAAISGLTRGQTCPDRISDFQVLLFSKWNEEIFAKQSEWIQEMIAASPEYKALKRKQPLVSGNGEGKFQKADLLDDLSNL
jgi:hypothetical protein